MANRKVLLICYYFPPLGGAGVGRPLALFRHLPQFGYACDVLTVKPVTYRVYEPELLENLDTEKIYRAGSHDPQRLMYLLGVRTIKSTTIERGKKVSDRFFPDPKVGWVKPAIRLGRTLCSNNRYDIILSTSPPISSHLVGRELARECRSPWVADYRDFWTLHKAEDTYDDPKKVERARRLLETIRTEAAAVTAVNPSTAEYVGAAHVIYNSYDSELAHLWRPPSEKETFVIGILGTLNELYPIEPLLRVLARLREIAGEQFRNVSLLQVGQTDEDWLRRQLEKYRLSDKCDIRLFQNRQETIRLLSRTSLLYVGVSSTREQGVILGRTFTLIASGRPILAAVPSGSEMEKLISRLGNGFCFTSETISQAVEYLKDRITQFEEKKLSITPLPEYAHEFSSENMAKNFARLFDSVIP